MLNPEDFNVYPTLKPIVSNIVKLLTKDKIEKIPKLIIQLEEQIDENNDLLIPITYILSIVAENNVDLITERLIQKIEPFIDSEDEKLKINSIIILGFFILRNPDNVEKFFLKFIKLLVDKSDDVRDNGHYFLQEFIEIAPNLIASCQNLLLTALSIEKKQENIVSLLNFLAFCNDFNFKQLYKFREISKTLISVHFKDKSSQIFSKLNVLVTRFFPSLKNIDIKSLKAEDLNKFLDNQFIMKKINFTEIAMKKKIDLNEFRANFKKSRLKDKEIYFYVKNRKKDIIYFFELEKEKVKKFFDIDKKISRQKIMDTFSNILENKEDLNLFMNVLIKLGHIHGYFSKLGYFYPYNHLKIEISKNFQKNGIVNLKKYDFLPNDLVHELILNAAQAVKLDVLFGKNRDIYYSLKNIQDLINEDAAKNSSIDLTSFREKLLDQHFIKLIKNLPREYLTNFRKGTHWLTNLGKTRIENEINNSKIVGFYDIRQISKKLNIKKILLIDVLELYIDPRSGVFDKSKEVFYYSKYLKERIEKINLISDNDDKKEQIELMARDLNIDKNHILSKIDENLRAIGEEIKKQDQIKISEYLEKTGMENEIFMNFIRELGVSYFKKGEILIFNPKKIENAKKDIKSMLIKNSKLVDFLSIGGNFDINSTLIEELIKELQKEEKIKGIFYIEEGDITFYTERGIRNLMMENNVIFSFHDLFYDKELTQDEIDVLKENFDKLIKEKKLKGTFDEETLIFSSDDVLFANDYNTTVDEFGRIVNNYVKRFDFEFQKIKKILNKGDETIFPKEIVSIQNRIDRINEKYVFWRDGLEATVKNANIKLLRQQGYNLKKFKALSFSTEKREEIRSFAEDPEIIEIMDGFNAWIKLFNGLELKYANVIFYQKRLITNPEDEESKKKLNKLLEELNLI